MEISIVLLTWNSEKYIKKCLNSVLYDLSETQFSYEIFIVDNGSKDNTLHILNSFKASYPKELNLVCLGKNIGTTCSRNLALKQATGNYIVIMDSDVEIIAGTLEKLLYFLKKNNDVGIVAPRLKYPSGRPQKSTDVFPTLFTKIYRLLFLKRDERRLSNLKSCMNIREVDYAISAIWMLKRGILKKVGLLDENIFYSPEDVDYCVRLRKSGYKILYYPIVTGIHHAQEISRGFIINYLTFQHIKGLIYYFNKHGCWFTKPNV